MSCTVFFKTVRNKIHYNQNIYFCSLIALFLVAFVIPLAFALSMGGVLHKIFPSSALQHFNLLRRENAEKDLIFPDSASINGPNSYVRINHSLYLEPVAGKDFMLSFWLKPRRLPAIDERYLVLSKFDERSASRRGYAFALARDRESVRPEVYWRDEVNGTWFTFSEINLEARQWILFVVTLRDGKFLGLHSATIPEPAIGQEVAPTPEVELLGGYELPTPIFPHSESDLLLGAFGGGKFRGQIGPLGIFRGSAITGSLDDILRELVHSPRELPAYFGKEGTGFWTENFSSDSSGKGNMVELVKPKRGDRDDHSADKLTKYTPNRRTKGG